MRTSMSARLALLPVFAIAGCATIQPRAGFDDVRRLLSERTRAELSWDGTVAPEVVERVRELLRSELTADSSVQVALLANRTLQATYAKLGIAQADVVQAGLPPNPVLTADVHFGTGASGTGVEVGLAQQFITVLQIPLRQRVAEAAFEQAKLEVAQAVWEQAASVRVAFYRLQGALQTLELRRTVAQSTAAAAEVARRQHHAGNITDLELAAEEALDDDARLRVAEAEEGVEGDREELNALLGLWGSDTTWTIASRLPELPETELEPLGLESRAMEERLDLIAARQELEVLARTVDLTGLYRLLPTGEAGLAAHREPESGFWSTGPSITLPIPVFDQRQAVLASDAAKFQQSEHRYAALAVEIRSEVRRWRTKMLSARRRATYYRAAALPRRQRVVDETQKEYNGMLVGVYQLLQAKRDQVETARKYIEALADYWMGHAELERAIGVELPVATSRPSSTPAEPATPAPHAHHHGG